MKIERRELPDTLRFMEFSQFLSKGELTLVIHSKCKNDSKWLMGTLEDKGGHKLGFKGGGTPLVSGTSDEIVINRLAAKISGRTLVTSRHFYYVPLLKVRS